MNQEIIDITIVQPITGILFFFGSLLIAKVSHESVIKSLVVGLAIVGLVFEVWYQLTAWSILNPTDESYYKIFYMWRYFCAVVAIIDLRALWGIYHFKRRLLSENTRLKQQLQAGGQDQLGNK